MAGITFYTHEELQGETPVSVSKCGRLKMGKRYEYSFNSTVALREALGRNRAIKLGDIHVAGIIRGNA